MAFSFFSIEELFNFCVQDYNNGVIERISVDKELKIFIETDNNKHYIITFNNYRGIYIRNKIFAETWESEIGEIELFREVKFEKTKVLANLLIKNQWDEDLIFSANVGNYIIEEI